MSRPSKAEQEELQLLESTAALNAAIRHCCKYLELRLRQAQRRALGNEHLLAVLEPCQDELNSIESAATGIRQLLAALLHDRQDERIEKNGEQCSPSGGT